MLREAIERILNDWPQAITQQFAEHPLAGFIRNDFPRCVSKIIESNYSDFVVTGGAGAGIWANVPWISILNPQITKSTQDGIYPVYLFCADASGLYLSLNQGTTKPRERFGTIGATERATKIKNEIYFRIPEANSWGIKEINLHASTALGRSYEGLILLLVIIKKNNCPKRVS